MLMQVDLTIEHDWSPLINKFLRIKNLIKANPEVKRIKLVNAYPAVRYDFGQSGSVLFYDFNKDTIEDLPSSAVMSGDIVTNLLPWIHKLKQDFSDLKLSSVCLQNNDQILPPHIDGQESPISGHCKCNFILDDYTDITYVQDSNGIVKSYPSHRGAAWLLDTTKLHWVSHTTVPRYVFQLGFHQDWQTVADWFSNKGPLIYQ